MIFNLIKMRFWHFVLLMTTVLGLCSTENVPCNLRETRFGSVCVCTADRCDYLHNPVPTSLNDFSIISSTKAGLRFASSGSQFTTGVTLIVEDYTANRPLTANSDRGGNKRDEGFLASAILLDDEAGHALYLANGTALQLLAKGRRVELDIDRNREYQQVTGFGGAFTGAVSHVLQKLPQVLQDHVYSSYFASEGIGFNLLRMSIGGSDFDLEPWAYNEQPQDDVRLTNFTRLDKRDLQKVQQLLSMKQVARLHDIKIYASAWSPPVWMKSNNKWEGFSHLKPQYYQLWADYHLRYLELMAAADVPIWAISTGNEPTNGLVTAFLVHIINMGWTPQNQAVWLSEHLGPTIKNSKFANVLIFGNDDQRFTYPVWFQWMNDTRSNVLDYLDGLSVHWYYDEIFKPNLIDATHNVMPDKLLLNTESCIGSQPWEWRGPKLGSWGRAERYVRAFMQDLQHSFNGWIDWNLALDEQGGPNYAKNFVDAPIIVNLTNGVEFYKNPMFYAIGHFSKFIPENSVRIDTRTTNKNIEAVAFRRPDERIVAVISNSGDLSVDVALNDSVRGNIVINIPAHSVHTIVYN